MFRCETYLNEITIKRFRDSQIRFRFGLNNLGINKRFNLDRSVSKCCPYCPNTYEDETHFIFICPKYQDLRAKYLNFVFCDRNYTVDNVLSQDNVENQRNVGMFLFYSMKLRNDS